MKRLLVPMLLLAAILHAQQTPLECTQAGRACQQINNYNGSNQITSTCWAISFDGIVRPRTQISISAATNANPVVLTSTGHGFALGTRPQVTISGATSGWTAVNGSFTATVVDANTFSIPVDSTAFGALSGTLVFTTTAPRTTTAEWAVRFFAYDISGNTIGSSWAGGNMSLIHACSGATLTGANAQ